MFWQSYNDFNSKDLFTQSDVSVNDITIDCENIANNQVSVCLSYYAFFFVHKEITVIFYLNVSVIRQILLVPVKVMF